MDPTILATKVPIFQSAGTDAFSLIQDILQHRFANPSGGPSANVAFLPELSSQVVKNTRPETGALVSLAFYTQCAINAGFFRGWWEPSLVEHH